MALIPFVLEGWLSYYEPQDWYNVYGTVMATATAYSYSGNGAPIAVTGVFEDDWRAGRLSTEVPALGRGGIIQVE